LRRLIKIELKDTTGKVQTYWGVTTLISEVGADISLTQAKISNFITSDTISVDISILEEDIQLSGKITTADMDEDFYTIHVDFDRPTLEQERKLIKLLFCRPGQWKSKNTPGELHSLWLLVKILLKPRILFDRNPRVDAINVAQISV
ncbi:MAG: PilZ domain-containing protein, partial [Waterburya sp.]